MADPTVIEHRVTELERDHRRAAETSDEISSKLRDDADKIRNLTRELGEVRKRVVAAEDLAKLVKKTLDEKERDDANQAAAMSTLGRWAQLALTVLIVALLGWSGQFTAALGKFQSLLGSGK
jgi:chromosome segregation ATPase